MDDQNGGQLSNAEKQRQTLTQMASREVDEVYRRQSQNYRSPSSNSIQPQANNEDWRKYHSAWQEYYQKYYGSYYGKAAQEYVLRERKKYEAEQENRKKRARAAIQAAVEARPKAPIISENATALKSEETEQIQNDIRSRIRKTALKRARRFKKSRHFVPITIGLSVILIGVLLQYNQVIIGNIIGYMSPGGTQVNAITAIDSTISIAVHETPTLMVPKINVEVPVIFGYANDWRSMNDAMADGVAHFSMSGANAMPGEIGNFAISGHSSNNIYDRSDWKFVFSGLTRMEVGDMIYMDYNGVRYAYRVAGSEVVEPSNVMALAEIANKNPNKPMITLITCTPLGTDKYRLLLYAEQISPDISGASTAPPASSDGEEQVAQEMPSGSDTPLEQFWKWLTGKD